MRLMLARLSPVVAVAMGMGMGLAGAASAQSIGQTERIELYAYGIKPGDVRRPLFARQDLVANQVVETVERGGAELRFVDDTRFTVGPASTVTLDRYAYDPRSSAGEAAVRLGIGTFRYISGRMAKEGVALKVPSATIGVRGTVIGFQVQEDQGSLIQVRQGLAVVTPDSGAPPVTVAAGQTAVVSPAGAITVMNTSGSFPPIGPLAQPGPTATDADGSPGNNSTPGDSGPGDGGGNSNNEG